MPGRSAQSGSPLSAEQQHARRQSDEALGLALWSHSTKTGVNLSAPTTADLRALGAKARAGLAEGIGFADAAVRAAADVASFGLADEISAGANALVGAGGQGTLAERYDRLHAQEQDLDSYNHEHRPIATTLGEVGMTALTFKGATGAGSKMVGGLSSRMKGKVGERMSDARTLLSGDIPVRHGKRLNLAGGGHTFTDHQTLGGKVVEAKLGPTAKLTNRQQQAKAELGSRYRYDHWSFNDVGRVVGGAAVSAQQGLGQLSDYVQDALYHPKRR